MDLLLYHSFPLHPSGCVLTSGMVGELVGDAHNTRPITFFLGPFPNAFRATPLIIHSNPSHDTMSSTILDLHPSSRPSRSPKNKCSLANNALCAPASPANRSSTILARAENIYPASPAPMTPASAIPLPRSPSFVSSRLVFSRSSIVHLSPASVFNGLSVLPGARSSLPRSFTSSISFKLPFILSPRRSSPLTPSSTLLFSVIPQFSLISPPLPPTLPVSALLSDGFLRPNPDGPSPTRKFAHRCKAYTWKVAFWRTVVGLSRYTASPTKRLISLSLQGTYPQLQRCERYRGFGRGTCPV
jgi:hypothetical protein